MTLISNKSFDFSKSLFLRGKLLWFWANMAFVSLNQNCSCSDIRYFKYHNYISILQQLIGQMKQMYLFMGQMKLLLKTVVFSSTKDRLEGSSKQRDWEDHSHLSMFNEECASNYVT